MFEIVCGLFQWKRICAGFFAVCLYLYYPLRSNYQEFKTLPHFCACPKDRTWILIDICYGHFCVQWFEVRGSCSCSWYWWNCWLLRKNSFDYLFIYLLNKWLFSSICVQKLLLHCRICKCWIKKNSQHFNIKPSNVFTYVYKTNL